MAAQGARGLALGRRGVGLVLLLGFLAHLDGGIQRGLVALRRVGVLVGDVDAATQRLGTKARQVHREVTLGHRAAWPVAQDGAADADRQVVLLVGAGAPLQTGGRRQFGNALGERLDGALERRSRAVARALAIREEQRRLAITHLPTVGAVGVDTLDVFRHADAGAGVDGDGSGMHKLGPPMCP